MSPDRDPALVGIPAANIALIAIFGLVSWGVLYGAYCVMVWIAAGSRAWL